jgi:hypothetical protein
MANSSFGDPIYVLKGEALSINRGTITPRGPAMSVNLADEELLTPAILQQWFFQSITPLVGAPAVEVLKTLLADRPAELDRFVKEAMSFRSGLK